jgi:hypothetical protein
LLTSVISFSQYPIGIEQDEDVSDYISQVSIDRIMADIQTLQDFETRFFQHPNSTLAQNWIKEQYEILGLDVELQELPAYYYSASNNVIAIQYGTEFPDEYVVCGAHYDSYSDLIPDIAPGADDNASGTSGILEIARILSQYDFKRSIIYCAFSGEEFGLYGSGYYAEQCAKQRMNIVAYFNMDMIGYLAPEEEIKIHFSNPSSAQILANYCENICDVYFPEIPFSYNHYMSNSDHRSFINVGYMGITSIEHDFLANPYYHTPDDLIGLGVNSPELVETFVRANIASIATLALYDQEMPLPPLAPPTNCFAEHTQDRNIKITWEAPIENSPEKYWIYKDDIRLAQLPATQLQYTNKLPQNDYDEHCYTVTAAYGLFGESEFSNGSCASVPVGIAESVISANSITVYPNPTRGELIIEMCDMRYEICDIAIFDILGKLVFIVEPQCIAALQFNISSLPAGIYFLRIQMETGVVITRKVVRN